MTHIPFRVSLLGLVFLLLPVMAVAQEAGLSRYADSDSLKEELAQTPEKTAGIYYAYPGPMDAVSTPAPEGYEPFYVSHYGRHGSRWITTDERYLAVIRVFDSCKEQSGLTPLGEDVRCRLQEVWEDARGRSGELTSVGVSQHRGIADRLYHRCPQVFADTSRIEARSSTAMRCAMSMTAFTERLKELNPSLCVTREAAPRYMEYMAYNSPEVKALSANTAFWRKDFHAFEDAHIHPDRLMASLFIRPNEVEDPRELMMGLYWIASDMQDVSLSLSFYDIFEPEELYGIWQCINYRMYVCNAASPVGGGAGPRSAASLLRNMVEEADRAIRRGSPAATLRFGHDTNLIRLLALMQVEGCCTQESDPALYHTAWQDFRISPMAANLQWVFYRNAAGHVMVKLLHNEREVRLPIESTSAPYYDWDTVKQHFESKITH